VIFEFLPLDNHIHTRSFDCGEPPLNTYLKRYALKNDRSGIGKTFVAIIKDDPQRKAVGYYTISMAQIEAGSLPLDFQKRLPRYPVPAMRIGRLAVVRDLHNKGLGTEPLLDALLKALHLSDQVGIYVVIVDAKEKSIGFYERFGFIPFTEQLGTLFLPVATIRQLFSSIDSLSDDD